MNKKIIEDNLKEDLSISPVSEIVEDLKQGKMVILIDDQDRENEGDLLIAADFVSAETINFMAKFGRGLICLTLTRDHCEKLKLPLMVSDNSQGTAFTVSIEASSGVTTGISAADRAHTILRAVRKEVKPEDRLVPQAKKVLKQKIGKTSTTVGKKSRVGSTLSLDSGLGGRSSIASMGDLTDLESPLLLEEDSDAYSEASGAYMKLAPISERAIEDDEEEEEDGTTKGGYKGSRDSYGPMLTTLFTYFVLKLAQEEMGNSAPDSMTYYFGWKSEWVGIYLSILALSLVPINFGMGIISEHFSDRRMIIVASVVMLFGCFIMLDYSYFNIDFTIQQYFAGSIIVFVSSQLLEGFNMSLLSKVVPEHLARGTFNSGFLAVRVVFEVESVIMGVLCAVYTLLCLPVF